MERWRVYAILRDGPRIELDTEGAYEEMVDLAEKLSRLSGAALVDHSQMD